MFYPANETALPMGNKATKASPAKIMYSLEFVGELRRRDESPIKKKHYKEACKMILNTVFWEKWLILVMQEALLNMRECDTNHQISNIHIQLHKTNTREISGVIRWCSVDVDNEALTESIIDVLGLHVMSVENSAWSYGFVPHGYSRKLAL